ncbi:uncharacterized protein N7500_004214 [Penicillium coprophilum]|uniref:uncharacterized protein n=1 Tax=Penicillium coprophilum TaxID=36646 RepID=UPI002389558C|nr:uncharacterized protein N7500_004214 [Penicillium coprophilum]KAJ5171431.1 hypothetical protein N7500_004214 [Penicillium coprophilum]
MEATEDFADQGPLFCAGRVAYEGLQSRSVTSQGEEATLVFHNQRLKNRWEGLDLRFCVQLL